MGFVDWAKLIGGGVAAPFTGGATLPIAMSGLSGVLGGAAKAGQDQNNKADQLKLLLENAKLNRDKFALDAPGERLATSQRANLAANATPSTLDWGPGGFKPGAIAKGQAPLPKWTGGVTGAIANMSPDAKQLSNQTMHDELISQLQGGASGPNGGSDKTMPTGIGESSTSDKVLGGASLGTSILGLLLGLNKGGGSKPLDTSGLFGDGSGDWGSTGIG